MRKPPVTSKTKNKTSYLRQAVDMGELSPKLTTKNASNLFEFSKAKYD
jgi:hypothetical protein